MGNPFHSRREEAFYSLRVMKTIFDIIYAIIPEDNKEVMDLYFMRINQIVNPIANPGNYVLLPLSLKSLNRYSIYDDTLEALICDFECRKHFLLMVVANPHDREIVSLYFHSMVIKLTEISNSRFCAFHPRNPAYVNEVAEKRKFQNFVDKVEISAIEMCTFLQKHDNK